MVSMAIVATIGVMTIAIVAVTVVIVLMVVTVVAVVVPAVLRRALGSAKAQHSVTVTDRICYQERAFPYTGYFNNVPDLWRKRVLRKKARTPKANLLRSLRSPQPYVCSRRIGVRDSLHRALKNCAVGARQRERDGESSKQDEKRTRAQIRSHDVTSRIRCLSIHCAWAGLA
jgi:hypothetical protein